MITPGMVGAGLQGVGSLIGAFSKLFTAHKQKKMADAINPVRSYYETSPYAKANAALGMNEMNGRAAGADAAVSAIQGAQAATNSAAAKTATSSADALSVATGAQATANQMAEQEAVRQQQFQQQGVVDAMRGNEGMVSEGDKVYQDKLLDYQNKLDLKNALLGASWQNKNSAFTGLGSGMMEGGNALMGAKSWKDIWGGNGGFGYKNPGAYGYLGGAINP